MNKGLHGFAVFLAFATFVLVLAGGLVTSTGSALAVPDWPLSFGQWWPRMVGGVRFEHSHRMIAGAVGFLTILLAVWLGVKDPRQAVRRLGIWTLGAVFAQGFLGGVTVLYGLPLFTSVAHACLGQIFFTLMVCIAVLTGPRAFWGQPPKVSETAPKLRRLGLMTTSFVFLQLVAGAIVRHSGRGFHFHLLGAVLVTVHILLLIRRIFREQPDVPELQRPAFWLGILLGVQLVLGFYSWRNGAVLITTAHVGVGALILADCTVLTMQSYRRLVPA